MKMLTVPLRLYSWMTDIIGLVTTNDSASSREDCDSELEYLLEAARRATWDALHGPPHLRDGRFRPSTVTTDVRPRHPDSG